MGEPHAPMRRRRRKERPDPESIVPPQEFEPEGERNQLLLWGVLAGAILLALLAFAAWNEWSL